MPSVHGALYGGVQIGDYAYATPSGNASVIVETIPRAEGAIIKFNGGGTQKISVTAWLTNVVRMRFELEEYLRDLEGSLIQQSPATLDVNGVKYTNSYYESMSVQDDGHHWATITANFIRSSTGSIC